jgi:hypothetical protein
MEHRMNKYLTIALSSVMAAGAYALPAMAQSDACLDQCSKQLISCDRQMAQQKMPGSPNDDQLIFAQCKQAERDCVDRCAGGKPPPR